jgi:hypothetical protein
MLFYLNPKTPKPQNPFIFSWYGKILLNELGFIPASLKL